MSQNYNHLSRLIANFIDSEPFKFDITIHFVSSECLILFILVRTILAVSVSVKPWGIEKVMINQINYHTRKF